MSKTEEQIEKENSIKESILDFVLGGVDGVEEIEETEENCGSFYITTKDGKSFYVSVEECEIEK
jgi:hypothetical protein